MWRARTVEALHSSYQAPHGAADLGVEDGEQADEDEDDASQASSADESSDESSDDEDVEAASTAEV